MKHFGEHVRELREAQDISLRELARSLNISAAFLSDIELGRRFPSEDLVKSLARKLKTTYDALSQYDPRTPIEDLKKKSAADPRYGFALRQVAESNLSADDLIDFVNRKRKGGK